MATINDDGDDGERRTTKMATKIQKEQWKEGEKKGEQVRKRKDQWSFSREAGWRSPPLKVPASSLCCQLFDIFHLLCDIFSPSIRLN